MTRVMRAALALGGALAFALPAASSSATTPAAPNTGQLSVNTGSGWTHAPTDPLFDITKIAPGWTETKTLDVRNDSPASAAISLHSANIDDEENGCNHPESFVDTTCSGANAGELGGEIILSLYTGSGSGGTFDATPSWTGSIRALQQTTGLGQLTAGASRAYKIVAELPYSSGNDTQTDSVSFDLVVGLDGAQVAVEATKTTRPPSNPIARAIDQLPFTGTHAQRLVAAGLTMLLIGTVLVLLYRRRTRGPESV